MIKKILFIAFFTFIVACSSDSDKQKEIELKASLDAKMSGEIPDSHKGLYSGPGIVFGDAEYNNLKNWFGGSEAKLDKAIMAETGFSNVFRETNVANSEGYIFQYIVIFE